MIIFLFPATLKSNTEFFCEDLIDISELPLEEESVGQSETR